MSLNVWELFGYAPTDCSPAALSIRKRNACPFVNDICSKRFRSGLVSGACTVKPVTSASVICCPNRMYAGNYTILQEIASDAFSGQPRLCRTMNELHHDGLDVMVFGKRWGKELRLPTRSSRGGYFVDWILARLAPDQSLAEFVAVEVQTMDTTGSYEAEVRAYLAGTKPPSVSKAGINLENVAKRILPQIIYKGHVLRQEPLCSKGMYFVCPKPVYDRIATRLGNDLRPYHKQAGALSFRWYDLADHGQCGSHAALIFSGQMTTTVDQVALAFTSPKNLPEPRVYECAIRAQLAPDGKQ